MKVNQLSYTTTVEQISGLQAEAPLKPFVKWAGGKSQLLAEIRRTYPQGLGSSITKYAEPFVGGGAVLMDILNRFSLQSVFICDINRELIATYSVIRDDPSSLIALLAEMQEQYLPLGMEERKTFFYGKCDRFNKLKVREDLGIDAVESAALFIFLNRTCFNGLYRVNAKGLYNVPMGIYKKPLICDAENIRRLSLKLQNVTIVCGDYRISDCFIDKNTFVYFDPPYRPLTETASFTSYAVNGFDDAAQRQLAEYVDTVSRRGAKVVVSNSDPKNVDENDNFFDELYGRHQINRVGAMRMINSNGKARGRINELLIWSA
jgi:DNA adenine methylase